MEPDEVSGYEDTSSGLRRRTSTCVDSRCHHHDVSFIFYLLFIFGGQVGGGVKFASKLFAFCITPVVSGSLHF